MTNNYLKQLNTSYENQTKLMEQSDGSKLHRASDDAVGYSKYLRYQNSLTENTQYQSNVSNAVSWMKTSDAALVSVTDIMQTFVGKTNAAANSTNNSSDMAAIGKEMLTEVQECVSDLNAQQGDRYVFSGQSDLTQPYTISTEKYNRGLTKTLNDTQKSFFNDTTSSSADVSQMLTLSDGTDTYYLNTKTGNVYTKDFVESGYKEKISAGQTTVTAEDAVGTIKSFVPNTTTKKAEKSVSDYFSNTGVIKDANSTLSLALKDGTTTKTLNFTTVSQQIVTYNGDDKYISMTKRNGAADPSSDSVNLTGEDIMGEDIFDNSHSGNTNSGAAALNNLLTVQAKTVSNDYNWNSTDGITLANTSHSTVVNSESKMAARQQVYEKVQTMLTTQNTSITSDVTTVADTDVAKLAVQLMTAQTIYNMSLSVGSKILPKSLADYLS